MFALKTIICIPIRTKREKQKPSTDRLPASATGTLVSNEPETATDAITVVTTELVTSTDMASLQTQDVAVSGVWKRVVERTETSTVVTSSHHIPSGSEDTVVQTESEYVQLGRETQEIPPPDTPVDVLWAQLRHQAEKIKKAQIILEMYRKREDQLAKALAAKDSALKTLAETTSSKLTQLSTANNDLQNLVRRAEQTAGGLSAQLAAERDRREAAEEANKLISGDLAAERDSRQLREFEIQQEQESAPSKLKVLERELAATKLQLTNETDALRSQLASDRALRLSDQRYAEQQRKRLSLLLDQTRMKIPQEIQKKQAEVDMRVGAPVALLRVGQWADDDLGRLTPVMLNHMKTVVEAFSKKNVVKRIEYLMNDELYKRYNETRTKLCSVKRNGAEILAFHGTNQRNIDSYFPTISQV
jgi:hypothetical protein